MPEYDDIIVKVDTTVIRAEVEVTTFDVKIAMGPPHTIASHIDTTATGAELEELTDGSETTLHSHAGVGQLIATIVVTNTGLSTAQVDSATILLLTGGGSDVVVDGIIAQPTAIAATRHVRGIGNGTVTIPAGSIYGTRFTQTQVFGEGSRADWSWNEQSSVWEEMNYWP